MHLVEYLLWHYSTALKNIGEIGSNYLRATWFRFAIPFHLRTLFYPWRRQLVDEESTDGLMMKLFMKAVTRGVDLYFRLIAALVRLSVVLTGLFACAFIMCFFAVVFVAWIFWPIVFIIVVSKGVQLLVLNS